MHGGQASRNEIRFAENGKNVCGTVAEYISCACALGREFLGNSFWLLIHGTRVCLWSVNFGGLGGGLIVEKRTRMQCFMVQC